MRVRLLEYLACPECHQTLSLRDAARDDEDVGTGALSCPTGHAFPILGGVPRLLPAEEAAAATRETVDGFGYEWTHESASVLRQHDEEQFLDWVKPLRLEDFHGKVVLDAGCGMGRWAACVARAGAKDVICMDLSASVNAARANLRSFPNAHVVQGDIFRPPLRRAFDVAYSIGVLHHTPDPEGAFDHVVSRVVPGGRIFAWVYGRENNGWIVRVIDPIRKGVTSRLPRPILWIVSTVLAALLQSFLHVAFRRSPDGSIGARLPLPYRTYLSWMARYDFRHNRAIVFDHLVPRLAFYIPGDEFRAWFGKRGMDGATITSRNGNSWRGLGVVP
jgi:SAM-dependent methyltransferase